MNYFLASSTTMGCGICMLSNSLFIHPPPPMVGAQETGESGELSAAVVDLDEEEPPKDAGTLKTDKF